MAILEPLPLGIVTPLVTYLTESGDPHAESMARLVDFQIDNGIHGVLAVGSTGEVGNLTSDQQVQTIEIVVEAADNRVPVWAGVVGLGTSEAVRSAKRAAAAGANALLVLPPMFFDSSDSELERHYSAVANAVDVPVIAYDVPPRTPRKIPTSVIASLAAQGILRGVKDSSGDLTSGRLTVEATAGIPGFRNYIGSELTMDASFLLGFDGMVPGFANVLPREAVNLYEAFLTHDSEASLIAQKTYLDLFAIIGVALPGAGGPAAAVNAIKVATALFLNLPMPRISEPLTQPTAEFVKSISAIVEPLGAVVGARG